MNLSSLSSNALYAKSKAMNARAITQRQYTEMAVLSDTVELCAYLKSKTPYAEAFAGIGTTGFSRVRLEAVIKRMIFLRQQKLLRYALLTGSGLDEYFCTRRAIDCIISCARHMEDAFAIDPYLLYLPDQVKQSLRIDLPALEACKSPSELLRALAGSPYYRLLYDVLSGGMRSLVHVQNILYRFLFESTAKVFSEKLSGKASRESLELLSELSDILTLSGLYRTKKYYGTDGKMLLHVFRSDVSQLSQKEMDALGSVPEPDEVLKLIAKGRYGKFFIKNIHSNNLSKRILFESCKKKLRSSSNAVVCAICYDELVRIEAANLSTIAEGISYKMNPDEILSLLIKE